ncbi:MAG: hypothetical protein LBV33_06055 [Lachnospiraceae bacterium]|jgi:hypothetical protein|nr:hypothetical protein [Lachnospiraceae bacterium]
MKYNDFYIFRLETRKKLGRLILYPELFESNKLELSKIFQDNEEFTANYIHNCTKNEKKAMNEFFGNEFAELLNKTL